MSRNQNKNLEWLVNLEKDYRKSIELLKELVEFGNQIPNGKQNHYELLLRVDKFLKEQEDENY